MSDPVIALIVFLFPFAYSPGPGNMVFAANGARFGFRATMAAHAGYHVATWIVTVAIGFGFAEVLQGLPRILTVIQWGGSAYVLYLAWRCLRSGAISAAPDAAPIGFSEGVILLVLNPKAYLIIALMFSRFLATTDTGERLAVIVLSTLFTLNNLMAFVAWTILGDRIAARFRDDGHARKLNLFFGMMLAGVAGWMLLG